MINNTKHIFVSSLTLSSASLSPSSILLSLPLTSSFSTHHPPTTKSNPNYPTTNPNLKSLPVPEFTNKSIRMDMNEYNNIVLVEHYFRTHQSKFYDSVYTKYRHRVDPNEPTTYDWQKNKCYLNTGDSHQMLNHYSRIDDRITPTSFTPFNISIQKVQMLRIMIEWYELIYKRFVLKDISNPSIRYAQLSKHDEGKDRPPIPFNHGFIHDTLGICLLSLTIAVSRSGDKSNNSKIVDLSNLSTQQQQWIQLFFYECKYIERLLYYIEQTLPLANETKPIVKDLKMMNPKDIGVIPSDTLPSPHQLFKLNDGQFIKLYLQFMLLMENDEEIHKRLKMKYINEPQLNQIKQQLIQQFPNHQYANNINNNTNPTTNNNSSNITSSPSSLPYLTLPTVYNLNKQQRELFNQQANIFINSPNEMDIYQYIRDINNKR